MPFSLVFVRGRLQPDGTETWTTPFMRMAIANQWGGFQFDGLSSGKYNVLVIGPAGRAEKYIDVGNRDATIKLKPWWLATP